MSTNKQPQPQEWHKRTNDTSYLISTSPSKLDHEFINASFASKDMYWAKELPSPHLELMLAHSLTLGLYKHTPNPSSPRTPSPTLADPENEPSSFDEDEWQQIGMARFATDHVSFAYLSDVFVHPEHRASGLGAWLMHCCAEVMDGMPFLRRAMLMASESAGKDYYGKVFGMQDIAGLHRGLVCMTKTGPGSALHD